MTVRANITYRAKHKEALKLKAKEYYQKNKGDVLLRTKRNHEKNLI